MILLSVLVLALLVGWLRGGGLSRLAELPLRQGGLALAALLLQFLVIYGPWLDKPTTRGAAVGAMLLSYLLLVLFAWLNRNVPGIALIGLGLCANLIVTAANGGFMPVSPEALQRMGYRIEEPAEIIGTRVPKSKDMVLPREKTRLWFLSDIFVTPSFPWSFVFSIGDVAISAGAFILVQKAMVPGKVGEKSRARPGT